LASIKGLQSGTGSTQQPVENYASTPVVSLKEITKTFPGGIVALDNVSLDVYRGEIVALLGENGAGKSTLVKVMYGVYTPDKGRVYVDGKPVFFKSPRDAIRKGIVMVSQVPQLIERLTVAENFLLSLESVGLASPFTLTSRVAEFIEKESKRYSIPVDPNARVWSLTYTQKQMAEILRAIMIGARVLILDEALTYLPVIERQKFVKFLLEFKSRGGTVVLITHKIPEALETSDRIVVLRHGRIVASLSREEATPETIRRYMFGEESRRLAEALPRSKPGKKKVIVVERLRVLDDYGREAVRGVSLEVLEGEVVGIAGIVGNGQSELIEAVAGLRKAVAGRVVIDGVDVTNMGAKAVRDAGVGVIPDYPLRLGVSADNTIVENIAALFNKQPVIDWTGMRRIARHVISKLNVKASSEDDLVKTLSGGNIMKVIIGRELLYAKKALVAYNPTRALDEVSAAAVRGAIKSRAINDGLAVLFASEDLDEVLELSDKVYVINTGQLYGPFDPDKTSRDEIEKYMVM
jgi:simple sugar transport system ATP-binding protein